MLVFRILVWALEAVKHVYNTGILAGFGDLRLSCCRLYFLSQRYKRHTDTFPIKAMQCFRNVPFR